jgi:hypothetical protein
VVERIFVCQKISIVANIDTVTIFAVLFTGKIALFANTGAKVNSGESLYPIYNNYKRLLLKK